MGIRHLDTFIRKKVPNGCFEINIENEISKYYNGASAADSQLQPPIIVIDLMTLYTEFSCSDIEGNLFGGRYNLGYRYVDWFFSRFNALGVTLEFFLDGPLQSTKYNTWRQRQDTNYKELIEIIDAVDKGTDVEKIVSTLGSPGASYALSHVSKRYGRLTLSIAKECDQELAAYASKVGAMAIISNDTDFLIFEGNWRFWSSRDLDFETFKTKEYNRVQLMQHLNLEFKQMPLFATLCGNDIVQFEEVRRFHSKLGRCSQKFYNVANFVRQQPTGLDNGDNTDNILSLLTQVFGRCSNNLKLRFQQSLDFYEINYTPPNMNPTNDPVLAILLTQANSIANHIWLKKPVAICLGMVDLRRNDIDKQVPYFLIRIMQRMAGIILYHHLETQTRCSCYIKLNHKSRYGQHNFNMETLPHHLQPPTMTDLLCKDPDIKNSLQDTKLKLLAWIASIPNNSLDHRQLQPIPQNLRATALSLYFLMQNQVLKLFEADLLLKVAYDVSFATYDPFEVLLPTKVESRPFRIVAIYKLIYEFITEAIEVVGLSEENDRADPPLDGVLFNTRYADWLSGGGDLEQIADWRIYANVNNKH